MIRDFIKDIKNQDIREMLINCYFDQVIAYPGSGIDILPCLIMEKNKKKYDLSKYGICKKNPIYIFCDPGMTKRYSNAVDVLNGKEHLSGAEVIGLVEEKATYGGEVYTGWEHVRELIRFERVQLVKGYDCWYEEIQVDDSPESICKIIILGTDAESLWLLFDEYDVSVDGMITWNEDKWDFEYCVIEKVGRRLPSWIIKNRVGKHRLNKAIYKRAGLDPEIKSHIWSYRKTCCVDGMNVYQRQGAENIKETKMSEKLEALYDDIKRYVEDIVDDVASVVANAYDSVGYTDPDYDCTFELDYGDSIAGIYEGDDHLCEVVANAILKGGGVKPANCQFTFFVDVDENGTFRYDFYLDERDEIDLDRTIILDY